ncbi:hypothetical protein HMPREF9946_04981 [Acetobacteraceae bacterium AT-5844]|nr:hypothetical protein HMPREF9946_04981 [Acetobacteraceae bacterium AT-5844]
MPDTPATYSAFEGARLLATGDLQQVALRAKEALDHGNGAPVFIFDNRTSQQVEVDFRGQPGDVLERLAPPPRRPGRPKLGVVAREVTLLPRHWEWLAQQPGGASVALRKLVEEARRTHTGADRKRMAQEACYRFMHTMAGDRPGFEDTVRALYANDRARFEALARAWPGDVGEHACRLAAAVWEFAEVE